MFHPFDASNDDGTCKWCGRRLRRKMLKFDKEGNRVPRGKGEPLYAKPGDYGDGHFCGRSCGYYFAVGAANTGFKFMPTKKGQAR